MKEIIDVIQQLLATKELDVIEVEKIILKYPQKKQLELINLFNITTYASRVKRHPDRAFDPEYGTHISSFIKMELSRPFSRFLLQNFIDQIVKQESEVYTLFSEYIASKQGTLLSDNKVFHDEVIHDNDLLSLCA